MMPKASLKEIGNMMTKRLMGAAVAASLLTVAPALAESATPLDAQASNPVTLGWMQGFPPAADKTIRFTDADYFAFPKLRWTVCNFRELMPTVAVPNGDGEVSVLPSDIDFGIDAVEFAPLDGGTAMTWDAAFDAFLVSFDDEGRVLASPKLSEAGSRALGLTTAPPITLAQDHAAPLAWHRARMDEIAIRR
jgi:hypothetical protein